MADPYLLTEQLVKRFPAKERWKCNLPQGYDPSTFQPSFTVDRYRGTLENGCPWAIWVRLSRVGTPMGSHIYSALRST